MTSNWNLRKVASASDRVAVGAAATAIGPTSETAAATDSISGGRIGLNGHVVVEGLVTASAVSANSKTFRVRAAAFGANVLTGARYLELDLANQKSLRFRVVIQNVNSESSQSGGPRDLNGIGFSTSSPVTSAVDTAAGMDIGYTVQVDAAALAATETLTLEWRIVRPHYVP